MHYVEYWHAGNARWQYVYKCPPNKTEGSLKTALRKYSELVITDGHDTELRVTETVGKGQPHVFTANTPRAFEAGE